jgi:Fe-S-cluster containining protein
VTRPDSSEVATAGDFSSWLGEIQDAIRGDHVMAVPCDGCTACCTSSQFVHIGPDEVDTLSHIPPALLFPAPRLPTGHVLLGYDERGHCPMLADGLCSIYAHRPRACRTYDCRIFPAAGRYDADENPITRRASRWRFAFAAPHDRTALEAVRAAALFLDGHRDLLALAGVPATPTQLAVLAIEVHHLFLDAADRSGAAVVADPGIDRVRAALPRRA